MCSAPPEIHDQPDHDPMGVEEGKFEPGYRRIFIFSHLWNKKVTISSSVLFIHRCKISEYDLIDDITSPYRCLAENLFLIVRKDRQEFEWEFPQVNFESIAAFTSIGYITFNTN